MPRYIDADALISKVCGYYCGCERTECGMEEINEPCKRVLFIEDAPTVSPDEVRGMGEWIHKPHIHGVVYCSECDYELRVDDTNYCPNCGAKMEVSK